WYSETPQQRACKELPRQFSLGNDRRFTREHCSEDERVHVAGMIEDQHRAAVWNAIDAADRDRNSHRRQRAAADPPERSPAPSETRQDDDSERSQQNAPARTTHHHAGSSVSSPVLLSRHRLYPETEARIIRSQDPRTDARLGERGQLSVAKAAPGVV